jgi:hypothetical protein
MGYCHYSAFRIICEVLRLESPMRLAIIVAALSAGGGAAIAFHNGMVFLGIMGGCALLWHCRLQRPRAAGAVTRSQAVEFPVSPGKLKADRCRRPPAGTTQMVAIVDQVMARYPRLREAKLIKANLLWHLHGDRDGARGHCHDLLSQTRTDDPLLEHICDLYLRTCKSRASESGVPAFRQQHPCRPIASTAAKTNIIPFDSVRAERLGLATIY